MLDLYINSKNSLLGLESALRIAISNANNFNTPGYKYVFASFTTMYSQALSSGTQTTNPLQFGAAMTLGSTSTDFSQGTLSIGTEMDNAIVGEGFFMVSSSATNFTGEDPKLYTRSGRFQPDASNKYLVDSFGRKVFGYKLDANGNRTSDTLVPIETNGKSDIGFIEHGILVSDYKAGKDSATVKQVPMYQLALTTFQNKQGLVLTSGGAYRATSATGNELAIGVSGDQIGSDGGTYGEVSPDTLEGSNVDVARVALDMNLINRSYAAVQAVIDDITKILSNIISKIVG